MMENGWALEERRGPAGVLAGSWPSVDAAPGKRAVAVCRVNTPGIVLGSTQSETVVDHEQAALQGYEVVRRRSGGGAVMVNPGDPLWVDVWVPRDDPLWSPDVGRAFAWLGDVWAASLLAVGATGMSVHRGAFVARTRWSPLVCFGGLGRGEVITSDGRKVVGVSQRRTAGGAWFHCACVLRWDPAPLLRVLALSDEDREQARKDLGAAAGIGDLASASGLRAISETDLVTAFVAALPEL